MLSSGFLIGCGLFAIAGLIAIVAGAATGNTTAIVAGVIALIVAVGFMLYAMWERKHTGPTTRRRRAVT